MVSERWVVMKILRGEEELGRFTDSLTIDTVAYLLRRLLDREGDQITIGRAIRELDELSRDAKRVASILRQAREKSS